MIIKTLIKFFALMYISTFRYRINGLDKIDALVKDDKRFVLCIWHSQLLSIIGCGNHGHKVATMISRSKDGGYFSGAVEAVGVKVVRASSSRGASAGTLEMLEWMNRGYSAAMAADGPKGPKYVVKSGSLYLAKKADKIIVPTLTDCKRFHKFGSWDNFILPMPFSKITVTFCDPMYFSDSLEKEDMDRELAELQNKMMELTRVYSENTI